MYILTFLLERSALNKDIKSNDAYILHSLLSICLSLPFLVCQDVRIMDTSDFSSYISVLFIPENNQPAELLDDILKPSGSHLYNAQRVFKLKIQFNYVFEQPIIEDLTLSLDVPDGNNVVSVVISAIDGSNTPVTKVFTLPKSFMISSEEIL